MKGNKQYQQDSQYMTQNQQFIDKKHHEKYNGKKILEIQKEYNKFNKKCKYLEIHERDFELKWDDGRASAGNVNLNGGPSIDQLRSKRNTIAEKLSNKSKVEQQNWHVQGVAYHRKQHKGHIDSIDSIKKI